MTIAVGLSHRTADMSTLERVAVPAVEVVKTLHELQQAEHIDEVMLVSTCNRVEVYAQVSAFHGGLADIAGVLARQAGTTPAELYDNLFVHYAGAAVEHLFSVAGGLDSMVVGESQILGQIRASYATAREAGTVGRTLHELVQTALRVGKRVHTETELGSLGASVVSEALNAGGTDLTGRHAVILGAGSMAALSAAQLCKAGIGAITVVNRTFANGHRLAENLAEQGIAASALPMDELTGALACADAVVCCTGAQDVILRTEHLTAGGRELLVFDLGLPRDVEAAVGELPGVRLLDLATLQRRMGGEAGPSARQTAKATGIVLDEVRDYLAGQRSAAVTPTVTALRRRAAEVVDAELLRLDHRLPELAPGVREELTRTVRRVVDKLLHAPTARVKQLAGQSGDTDYATALRELFQLDPQAPAALAAPVDAKARMEHAAARPGNCMNQRTCDSCEFAKHPLRLLRSATSL